MVANLGRPFDDDEAVVGRPDRVAEERLDLQGTDYRAFANVASFQHHGRRPAALRIAGRIRPRAALSRPQPA
jgi:hypothetical protein